MWQAKKDPNRSFSYTQVTDQNEEVNSPNNQETDIKITMPFHILCIILAKVSPWGWSMTGEEGTLLSFIDIGKSRFSFPNPWTSVWLQVSRTRSIPWVYSSEPQFYLWEWATREDYSEEHVLLRQSLHTNDDTTRGQMVQRRGGVEHRKLHFPDGRTGQPSNSAARHPNTTIQFGLFFKKARRKINSLWKISLWRSKHRMNTTKYFYLWLSFCSISVQTLIVVSILESVCLGSNPHYNTYQLHSLGVSVS